MTKSALVPLRSIAFLTAIALTITLCVSAIASTSQDRPLDDQDVADAVENELSYDGVVDVNSIEVNVVDGVVELTGICRNLLARERAAEIAELVKGVRSVTNRIVVKPLEMRSDDVVRADVADALLRDPATDAYELDVDVEDGTVTLTGEVDSWAEKELAERVVKGVRGVTGVDNRVSVYYEIQRPSHEIEAEIQRRMRWDVLLDDGLIDVAVDPEGNVTLNGVVGSAADKQRARVDSWVSGVSSVDVSNLAVEWWADDERLRDEKYAEKSDMEIARAIEDAALYDPRLSSFDVKTDVEGGWVTLRGIVDNLKAKRAAQEIARHTVGVLGVTNRLKVRPHDVEGDEVIEANVLDALVDHPTTDATDITVTVSDGRVTLSGSVASATERELAERIASGVAGVTQVFNLVTPRSRPSWVAMSPGLEMPTLSDEALEQRIRDEIFWSPYVDSENITVSVDDGKAILEGAVDNWFQYREVAENAFQGGARSIDNRLTVKETK